MIDDETLRIIVKAAAWAAIIAFLPQISRFFRRIGYREEHEVAAPDPWRGLKMIGGTVVIFLAILVITI